MSGGTALAKAPTVFNMERYVPFLDKTLGGLARDLPGATRVFRQFGLDFCCNGQDPLRDAAARKGLSPDALEQALSALQHEPAANATDWRHHNPLQLIAHLETRYHAEHRQQLPELIQLAARVERVHSGKPGCPIGLAMQLARLHEDLLTHMQKEQQVLFPLLAADKIDPAQAHIGVMRHEHLQLAAQLAELTRLAHGMEPPHHACTTWRALYTGLQQFRDDLIEHLHLENNVLFEGRATTEVAHG
jgi:regulator of cell morphogenesis and NO signaling